MNFLSFEASSCKKISAAAFPMFTYALAKAARMGYIDKHFGAVAKKGFEGIISNFIETDEQGLVHLTKVVSVGGLGGTPYRDGSFAYYISEPLRTDDLKGVGPFIQASIEIELMRTTDGQTDFASSPRRASKTFRSAAYSAVSVVPSSTCRYE